MRSVCRSQRILINGMFRERDMPYVTKKKYASSEHRRIGVNEIGLLLLGLAVIGLLLTMTNCGGSDEGGPLSRGGISRDLSNLGIAGEYQNFRKDFRTPGGARVKSTTDNVPPDVLALIDEGLQNQITRHSARYPHWPFYKTISDYDVLLIEPMCHNVESTPGAPCIFAMGIQTAGTTIGTWPYSAVDKPYIVVPHQAGEGWQYRDYFMRSVWHESEHVREFKNSYDDVFQRYLGPNDVHPHVP